MPESADARRTAAAAHVLARYAWAIDDRAWVELAELFTADVVADYGAFTCQGVAELVDRMSDLHAGLRTTQHLVGSVLAQEGPDGTVRVRSHVRATLVRGSGDAGRVEVAASYRDTMVPAGGGLLIAARSVEGRWISGERSILPWFGVEGSVPPHVAASSPGLTDPAPYHHDQGRLGPDGPQGIP